MNDTHDFLAALWQHKPAGAGVQLWFKTTKNSSAYDTIEQAAHVAVETGQRGDTYVHAGLAPRATTKPIRTRLSNADVVGIPGLWADIDVDGGPEDKTGAAPDLGAAFALAGALLEPTVLVNSGYGLQAWWLFEDPWLFHNGEARQQAARISQAWQMALRAAAPDFGIDATHDLARLMRVPGTFNHKGKTPAPVELLDHDGPRYELESIMAHAGAFMAEADSGPVPDDVRLDAVTGTAPMSKIDQARDIEPAFAAVWDHVPSKDRELWTPSEYDMSIASHLARMSFTDQEIADSIAYNRRRFGRDEKEREKGTRVDYLRKTIAKARGEDQRAATRLRRERQRVEAEQHMVHAADDEERPAPSLVTSMFSRVIGGPEIKELVQDGREPLLARFRLILADGREVPLGTMTALADQQRFRSAFAVVTNHYPARVKSDKWDKVVQTLLSAADVREGIDTTQGAQTRAWLDRYLERRVSSDRDGACQVSDPFRDDDYIHVHLDTFHLWVRKLAGDRIEKVDLRLAIEQLGFDRKTIAYTSSAGKRTSRSYYRIPVEAMREVAA